VGQHSDPLLFDSCWDVTAVSWHSHGGGGSVVWGTTDGALWYGIEWCNSIWYTLLILQGQTESVSGIK